MTQSCNTLVTHCLSKAVDSQRGVSVKSSGGSSQILTGAGILRLVPVPVQNSTIVVARGQTACPALGCSPSSPLPGPQEARQNLADSLADKTVLLSWQDCLTAAVCQPVSKGVLSRLAVLRCIADAVNLLCLLCLLCSTYCIPCKDDRKKFRTISLRADRPANIA